MLLVGFDDFLLSPKFLDVICNLAEKKKELLKSCYIPNNFDSRWPFPRKEVKI